ncbi:phytanoyl-CoA dioxygenase [Flagelloscypha sp. PMI_526]|nr:phytanoyl-CoA dioxygenase [Flagelloscypha sp. PMI_526]
MPRYLSQEQIDAVPVCNRSYLVIPGFLSQSQTNSLLSRSKQLLDEFSIEDHPMTKFTTGEDDHPKDKAVNKIGHALHELDPEFQKVTLKNEDVKNLVRDIGMHKDPVALQSMVICKQPEIGGEVGPHNDSFYTDPPTALGLWFALEECTASNGALSFIPGSHLTSPISKRFVRLPQGGTGFEILLPDYKEDIKGEYLMETPLTCKPGDLVIIHGAVLHKSEKNTSQRTRFAYTFHAIESPPYAKYDEKNWLQPTTAMPFSKLFT